MHQLIKFFGKRNYAEQFLQGELYMNSLSYFWDNGFEEQKDLFEGVSETFDKKESVSQFTCNRSLMETLCFDWMHIAIATCIVFIGLI